MIAELLGPENVVIGLEGEFYDALGDPLSPLFDSGSVGTVG
jgi:hypothetical protein